ncbi:MAG TPA: aldehyde dehydrogenase family protein [Acidimicrobiales bacterium]|nr:aldehyde dehydrogenase family protein [Acidimicrobiales bacterium]
MAPLTSLEAGMRIPFGGNQFTEVPAELAASFEAGDHLVVVQSTGTLLRIPSADLAAAHRAVDAAAGAFTGLRRVSDDSVSHFFGEFADRLTDPSAFAAVAEANAADVADATSRGRSTTRLALSETMRADMVEGLRAWASRSSGIGDVIERTEHDGWHVEQIRAGLGVIGFVFEGRPNVFADAAGLLRTGNTVVFRIGSDALRTARAIVGHAVEPALAASGLPAGSLSLVDAASRASGYALFTDRRLALAVARGSGPAVEQLGTVAAQCGIPVSLHGTGGAWIVVHPEADSASLGAAVEHSLDRKVCNTLNTICVTRGAANEQTRVILEAFERAGSRRDTVTKVHVTEGDEAVIPPAWFAPVAIDRATGTVTEPQTQSIGRDQLGHEWEWENSPEVTLCLVESVDEAVELFNTQSPHFAASLVGGGDAAHQHFYEAVDAPFVGNGMTRWVDGQYAFDRPELGLSNWERGRLLGRGGVLSGDSIYTVRTRATQHDPHLRR